MTLSYATMLSPDEEAPDIRGVGNPISDAAVSLPVLVGMTGKRILDEVATASVARRLGQSFRQLDKDLPHVPKVLLTGGAYGVDTIAARLLLARDGHGRACFPNWSVVVLLPFDRDLFEKDYRAVDDSGSPDAALAASRLAQLNDLLGASERVLVRVLPALCDEHGPVRRDQLDKDAPQADAAVRHAHYEQVGQLIAETATILIAVMDGGETAGHERANGSTARVVACRRAGKPDAVGLEVARRSMILRHDWDSLIDPPTAHVWLIEPARSSRTGKYPVTILDALPATSDADADAQPALPPETGRRQRSDRYRALRHSLAIPRALERLQIALARQERTAAKKDQARRPNSSRHAEPPTLDLTLIAKPTEAIRALRTVISAQQRNANAKAERAFKAIAALFVAAVLCLEIYAKFFPEKPGPLACYLAALLAIFAVIVLARWRRWQPLAEDLRAVNEMLRVQRAWWSAGLTLRVDREHLQWGDTELLRVRDAVRTMLGWVLLRSPWAQRPECDWIDVRGAGTIARSTARLLTGTNPSDWIGSQIYYFARNHRLYHRRVRWLGAITWSLFATSGWLAVLLCVWLQWDESRMWSLRLAMLAHRLLAGNLVTICSLICWVGLGILLVLFWGWLATRQHHEYAGHFQLVRAVPFTIAAGTIVAGPFALAILIGAALLEEPTKVLGTIHLSIVVFVTLTAIAGALRYVSEKLNFDAQALEYRDALQRFERAERLLAAGADPQTGAPGDPIVGQQIVEQLGRLALRENETWLKARRERPLSPVVG